MIIHEACTIVINFIGDLATSHRCAFADFLRAKGLLLAVRQVSSASEPPRTNVEKPGSNDEFIRLSDTAVR